MSKRNLPLLAAVLLLVGFGLWAAFSFLGRPASTAPTSDTLSPAPAALAASDSAASPLAPGEPTASAPALASEAAAPRSSVDASGKTSFDLERAQWIEGVLLAPPGAPADDELMVAAYARRAGARAAGGLAGAGAAAELAAAAEAEPSGDVGSGRPETVERRDPKNALARTAVSPEGRFRLPLPPDSGEVDLQVEGRYLYLTKLVRASAGGAAVELRPELGAWISGRLAPPPAHADESPALGEIPVALRQTRQSTDFLSDLSARELRRDAQSDAQGAFELRAVPAGAGFTLDVKPAHFAPTQLADLSFAPGEHRELALSLLRGGRLSGRVVDTAGAPVVGAEIDALRETANLMTMGAAGGISREAKSDADGRFEIAALPAGKLRVMAKADGYLRSLGATVAVEDEKSVEAFQLVLDAGASISGRVRWSDGSPAAGAKVEAEIDPSQLAGMGAMSAWRGASSDTVAGADGSFTLRGLGKGKFVLHARTGEHGDGKEGARPQGLSRAPEIESGRQDVELVLEPALTLRGFVRDGAGEPVANFSVELRSTSIGQRANWFGRKRANTQRFSERADGSFELSGLEPGRFELVARAQGLGQSPPLELELPATTEKPVELAIPTAARVSGIVVTPAGEPLPNAQIKPAPNGGPWGALEQLGSDVPQARSDEQGHFEIGGLMPGRVVLAAKADGFASSETLELELSAGQRVENARLVVRVGGRVLGTIYDAQGKKSSGRQVWASNTSAGEQRMATSDAQGEFVFDHLLPGNWQVVAMGNMAEMLEKSSSGDDPDPTAFMSEMKMTMVEIADGQEQRVLLGAPPDNPIRVTGRVSAAGAGVKAMISFLPEGGQTLSGMKLATSSTDGGFEIVLDKPGSYTVSVQQLADGFGRQNTIEFSESIPAEKEYGLALELPLGSITGRVYDSEGAALSGARVSLSNDGPLMSGFLTGGQYNEVSTDSEGRYRLPFLRKGTYSVLAGGSFLGGFLGDRAEFGRQVHSGISIDEGQALEGIDFRLDKAGQVSGRVLDDKGKAVPEAAVYVRDAKGKLLERISFTVTDGAGRYRYSGLSDGEYSLSARKGNMASIDSTLVRVRASESAEQDLSLAPGTMLLVSLVDENDKPIRAAISVLDSGGRQVNGMMSFAEMMQAFQKGFSTLEQRIGPLPPGSYKVTATSLDGKSKTKPVTLSGQPERALRIKLKE